MDYMTPKQAQAMLDKILGQVFSQDASMSLEQFMRKYAFDIRLPQRVFDSTTGEPTWTQAVNPTKFISIKNAWGRDDWDGVPKRPINGIEDILTAWNEVNYTATDRHLDSLRVAESDNVYTSECVYRSLDVSDSKYVLLSDGVFGSEYIAAGQRSYNSSYSIRIEDSQQCSNSFSVVWSKKVVNSMFIQDCSDMYECMFCSHITNKKFCIANMQFDEEEYRKIKDIVVKWILAS